MAESSIPTLAQFAAQLQQHRATPAPVQTLRAGVTDPSVPSVKAGTDLTYKGKDYIAFSATGQPKTETEYRVAYDQFNKTGKSPRGFTILEAEYKTVKDKDGNLKRGKDGKPIEVLIGLAGRRDLFNKISQATQQGITATGRTLGKGSAELLGLLSGIHDPAQARSVRATGGDIGTAVAENVINPMIATPEATGATVGLVLASVATGGVIPGLRAMSGFLPALIRAGGVLAGTAAGQELTGTRQGQFISQRVSAPINMALISAGTEGLSGIVRISLKSTLTQRAQKLFDADITDLLQSKYPAVANQGPAGLSAVMSTPKGLSDITQAGIKSLRGSTREATEEVFNELVTTAIQGKSALPRAFKTSTRDTLKSHFDEMIELSNKSLDNIGDNGILARSNKSLNEIATKVRNLIASEFKGSSDINTAMIVNRAIDKLNKAHDNLKDGAYLIKAMKDAAKKADGNLTPQAFQEHVKDTFKSVSGSLTERAGFLSGRGADIAKTGADVTQTFQPSFPFIGPLNKFLNLKRRELYRRPVGTVLGERGITATRAAAASGTNQAIKDFLVGE